MTNSHNYINLARKYRPQVILDLIGQDVLVKTLEVAFEINKIAHAFMLTGVRGVGKTTTARIIAKALNCTGEDGNGGITLNPCGRCENCVAITNDNHMDVIELDAASKTGVDDIREIIENGKYKPVLARYKVFIIDEVHMLSKNAFNALLKTLEEPPQHLKFIFATTEIKKIPITILSRCQRFDLKRITVDTLSKHLKNICAKENITFDEEGIFLLAKAASGSVRDSLSLLDQAIVFCNNNINKEQVQDMLGQGNKEDIYNLFIELISNKKEESFNSVQKQYIKGLESDSLLENLLEICHNATCFKMLEDPSFLELSEIEYEKSKEIAKICDLSQLVKIWQVLLKGVVELKNTNNPMQIINMLVTKILLIGELGNLDDLIKNLKDQPSQNINTLDSKKKIIDSPQHSIQTSTSNSKSEEISTQNQANQSAYQKEQKSIINSSKYNTKTPSKAIDNNQINQEEINQNKPTQETNYTDSISPNIEKTSVTINNLIQSDSNQNSLENNTKPDTIAKESPNEEKFTKDSIIKEVLSTFPSASYLGEIEEDT